MTTKVNVEVHIVGDEWEAPKQAAVVEKWGEDWLHYELKDGTNGLARPQNWRYKPKPLCLAKKAIKVR